MKQDRLLSLAFIANRNCLCNQAAELPPKDFKQLDCWKPITIAESIYRANCNDD